ncbi:MAG: CdaR family protein [Syntrophorhabdaceae bacterium]|nr:CdaR family protein [Syntrophorhabdaceae bacterium]
MIDRIDKILLLSERNLPIKLLALCLAVSAWWFVARENQMLLSFSVPVEVRNIPRGMTLTSRIERQFEVRLQGPSYILSGLKPSDITLALDLSNAGQGRQSIKFDLRAIKVPSGVRVQSVYPQSADVVLEQLERRKVPVAARIKSWKLIQQQISKIEIEPREVEVEALPEELSRIRVVNTQEIEVEPGMDVFTTVALLELPEGHARITNDTHVRVKIHFHK